MSAPGKSKGRLKGQKVEIYKPQDIKEYKLTYWGANQGGDQKNSHSEHV
jgi:hypothetical protein